jgi:hypothetical protein
MARPDYRLPRPARLTQLPEQAHVPHKRPYRMHHGGMLHKLACRRSGNMQLPAHLDDFGNSLMYPSTWFSRRI